MAIAASMVLTMLLSIGEPCLEATAFLNRFIVVQSGPWMAGQGKETTTAQNTTRDFACLGEACVYQLASPGLFSISLAVSSAKKTLPRSWCLFTKEPVGEVDS